MSAHVRGCKKALNDCPVCGAIVAQYATYSLPELAVKIQDIRPRELHTTLAAVAVENLIDRTTHESARGKRDVRVAMSTLKGYEQRGGGL